MIQLNFDKCSKHEDNRVTIQRQFIWGRCRQSKVQESWIDHFCAAPSDIWGGWKEEISVVLGLALNPLKSWAGLGPKRGPKGAQGSGFRIPEPELGPWTRACPNHQNHHHTNWAASMHMHARSLSLVAHLTVSPWLPSPSSTIARTCMLIHLTVLPTTLTWHHHTNMWACVHTHGCFQATVPTSPSHPPPSLPSPLVPSHIYTFDQSFYSWKVSMMSLIRLQIYQDLHMYFLEKGADIRLES